MAGDEKFVTYDFDVIEEENLCNCLPPPPDFNLRPPPKLFNYLLNPDNPQTLDNPVGDLESCSLDLLDFIYPNDSENGTFAAPVDGSWYFIVSSVTVAILASIIFTISFLCFQKYHCSRKCKRSDSKTSSTYTPDVEETSVGYSNSVVRKIDWQNEGAGSYQLQFTPDKMIYGCENVRGFSPLTNNQQNNENGYNYFQRPLPSLPRDTASQQPHGIPKSPRLYDNHNLVYEEISLNRLKIPGTEYHVTNNHDHPAGQVSPSVCSCHSCTCESISTSLDEGGDSGPNHCWTPSPGPSPVPDRPTHGLGKETINKSTQSEEAFLQQSLKSRDRQRQSRDVNTSEDLEPNDHCHDCVNGRESGYGTNEGYVRGPVAWDRAPWELSAGDDLQYDSDMNHHHNHNQRNNSNGQLCRTSEKRTNQKRPIQASLSLQKSPAGRRWVTSEAAEVGSGGKENRSKIGPMPFSVFSKNSGNGAKTAYL